MAIANDESLGVHLWVLLMDSRTDHESTPLLFVSICASLSLQPVISLGYPWDPVFDACSYMLSWGVSLVTICQDLVYSMYDDPKSISLEVWWSCHQAVWVAAEPGG